MRYFKSGLLDESDICGEKVDHAVVVVAYTKEEKGCLALKLRNSWGEEYGENGYFYGRVCEDSCGMLQMSSYVILPEETTQQASQ